MAIKIPSGVPEELKAGNTWQFDVSHGDFDSSLYTLSATLWKNETTAGKNRHDDTGTTRGITKKTWTQGTEIAIQGSGWRVTVAGANGGTGSDWVPGRYEYSFKATAISGGAIYEVASGTVDVKPNPASTVNFAATYDQRTKAQYIVDKIDQAIATRIANGVVDSYAIGTRNLQYMAVSDLRKLRGHYAHLARVEAGKGRKVLLARFGVVR